MGNEPTFFALSNKLFQILRNNFFAQNFGSIHFNIVQTAAVGIGLFLPPMGVGLLMALRFANLSVGQHWRSYMPYLLALMVGLVLIILFPQISLFLPRSAGLIK